MVPSLRASDVVSRFAIRCLISSLISDGLSSCMVRSSNSRIQCFGQSGQLALHGSINHQVTCADDGATQNRSVDRGGDVDFPAEAFLQGSSQFAGLVGAQGKCRNDFHIDALFLLRFQLFEQHRNGRQGRQALVARQQGHKVAPALVQLVRAQLQESVCLLLGCNLGIGQQSGDAGVTGHSSGEVEHRRPLLQGTGFVSKLKRCFRVGSGNRCKFCHIRSRYSSAASCSSILPWAAWSTEAARIFSAPAMDRPATCARNISLARFTSRSISVWAECFRRSTSTRACSLASSTSWLARLLACSIRAAAWCLASRRVSAAFSFARSRSLPAWSAACRPWAIFSCRSCMALINGGHTNFMQNHTKMAKATTCPRIVALISIPNPLAR